MMNRLILHLLAPALLFLLSANPLPAQDSIVLGGEITSDTSFSGPDPEIHVMENVVVTNGAKLLLTNTIVRIAPGVSIQATDGQIQITGDKTGSQMARILPLESRQPWDEISATGENSSLTVDYADVSGGRLWVFDGAVGNIQYSYIHDFDEAITGCTRAAVMTVSRCHFARYYETLFRFTLTKIEYCLFENITGDGIDFDGAVEGSFIRQCTLRHGDVTNVDGIDIGSETNPITISGCVIYDFLFDKGISIGEHTVDTAIDNCLIYDCLWGIAPKDSSNAILSNSTIVDCERGLRLYEKVQGQGGGHLTGWNNILWNLDQSVETLDDSTIELTFSDVGGNEIFPGEGNLNVDPLFLSPADRDYRLQTESPLAGQGMDGTDPGIAYPLGGFAEPPTNLSFSLQVTHTSAPDGSNITLSFQPVPWRSYSLLKRSSFSEGDWEKARDFPFVPPDSSPTSVDLEPLDTSAFFQIVTPALP